LEVSTSAHPWINPSPISLSAESDTDWDTVPTAKATNAAALMRALRASEGLRKAVRV
jgi:hypothetical protein